jgi:AhpD family alkylhydroperoxidase
VSRSAAAARRNGIHQNTICTAEVQVKARIENAASQLDITAGVQQIFKAIYAGGVPAQTLELVHLRASQINGCSACVNAGGINATKAGISTEKLLTLAAWYEDPRYDDAERAALALTEAATRLADRPGAVTDEIWAEAVRHYNERQLGALVLMVAITNFFNRINTTFRVPAGTRWD